MSHLPKFNYQLFGLGQAEAATEGYDMELRIYDVIGEGDPFFGASVSARYVLDVLTGAQMNQAKSLLVRINSPGGSTSEGFGIYNHLIGFPGKVTTRNDAMAGSMASIILLAGEEREMAYGATVMIHNPFAVAEGEARELRGIADMLDRQRAEMLAIYSKRTGLSVARVAKMVDATTWMGGEEALELGFVTRLTGRPVKMAAAAVPADIASAPPHIRKLLAEQAQETLAAIKAAEKGETPGSSKMDEETMKAEVAKAVAAAQAAVEAVAKKDEEMASLKAAIEAKDKEIAKLQAALEAKGEFPPAKGEFPPKEEESESGAKGEVHAEVQTAARIVQAAAELTGVKEVAKIEGALMALLDAPKTPTVSRAQVVDKLIGEGKLLPARRAWALATTQASLDAYLEGTGGVKVAALNVEHQANEVAARAQALGATPGATIVLTRDDRTLMRTMGVSEEKYIELKRQQLNGKAS